MAASTFSPGGFSYAQAAKGRTSATTSQTPSSKVTSGTATPATGTFSELTPGSNWADDVESGAVKQQKTEPQPTPQEEHKSISVQDPVIEQIKSEDKTHQDTSAVSSPDATSSSSTTTKEDDASSAPNASSSESTWETKSQTSEPAWIAERSQRQNNKQESEESGKQDKKGKETPAPAAPKPVVLQEAAPPTVNPWLKRAQLNVKPATSSPSHDLSVAKETQKPSTVAPTRQSPVANAVPPTQKSIIDDSSRSNAVPPKHGIESKGGNPRSGLKFNQNGTRSDSAVNGVKSTPNGRSHAVKASPAPPSVTDGISWPTPDTAVKERNTNVERTPAEKREDDTTPATKRKKQEYKQLSITPTFVYDTTGTTDPRERKPRPPGASADRPSRGSMRGGRGGIRGAGGSERQNSRSEPLQTGAALDSAGSSEDNLTARDRSAMPPPPRPGRELTTEGAPERNRSFADRINARKQSAISPKQSGESMTEATTSTKTPNGTSSLPIAETSGSQDSSNADSNTKDDDIPQPIPRRTSVGTQTEDASNGVSKGSRVPPIRMVATDSRKENRGFADSRDGPFAGPRGGAKRSGRGRGGNREVMTNGHPGASAYGGAHAAEFASPASYGVPASPSTYNNTRGNHQYPYSHSGRGSWRGNNIRAHSIPIDQHYGHRFGGPYHDPQQSPHLQTFYPGLYDNNGFPMSPMQYPTYIEADPLWISIAGQLEYYFSFDNLLKDMFLRRHMDSQGLVFLDVVANFPRMKQALFVRSWMGSASGGCTRSIVRRSARSRTITCGTR